MSTALRGSFGFFSEDSYMLFSRGDTKRGEAFLEKSIDTRLDVAQGTEALVTPGSIVDFSLSGVAPVCYSQ